MSKTLVTGVAGFMGSHLARALIREGHTVVGLDDLSGGFRDNIPAGVEFVEGSITDHALLSDLFIRHRFDHVHHLAAYAAEGLSHFIRRFNYTNNLIGSANLINESVKHQIKCFVFTSSIAVYGSALPPMREDGIPIPEDPYGIAKLAVEQDLKSAHEIFGLPYVIFRPHNVYGENQNIGDRYRNVIGIFMNQIMQGQPLTVFGDGLQTRAFTYVSDVIEPMAVAADKAEARNQVFNVGSDRHYTIRELIAAVSEAMNEDVQVRFLPARIETQHAYSDHSKLKRVFGSGSEVDLKEGIARMANWAKSAGARTSPRFEAIEVHRNLPSVWLE